MNVKLVYHKCLSCDNINYIKVDGEYKCLPSNPIQEGYYIDNNLYKKCYNTCKTCSKGGINNINNCNECIYGNLIKTSDSTSNCCTEDKQLWYLSGSNFFCISSCPEIRPIFVEKTNQCVENCLSKIVYFIMIIIIMYIYIILNVILHVQMVMNQMRKIYV